MRVTPNSLFRKDFSAFRILIIWFLVMTEFISIKSFFAICVKNILNDPHSWTIYTDWEYFANELVRLFCDDFYNSFR